LRDADGLGGTTETALVYNRTESLEVVEVEVDDHGREAKVVGVASIIVWEPMRRHAYRSQTTLITLPPIAYRTAPLQQQPV
jgi:hypothetical protein